MYSNIKIPQPIKEKNENTIEKKRPKKKDNDDDKNKNIPYYKVFPNEFIFNYYNLFKK